MKVLNRDIHPVLFYGIAVVAAFFAGVAIFNSILLPGLVGRGDVVIVPDLEGMSLGLAEERCSEAGLSVTVVGNRYSDEAPEGYVIEQDPSPEGSLKGGRAIRVVVSSGCKMEVVPDLVNRTLRQAELLLESARLRKGRVARIFGHGAGENLVVSTSPAPGSEVPRSSAVDILLEMRGEPREFVMPDLVGKDLPFVKDRLERMGFQISRIVTRREGDKFPNTILSHDPPAGSLIKEGEAIELVVSTVD
ncbi:MAG TPA: PASTA domain-containing protein [Candidatus Eisenbacteria bacterium]|uniref:PASTA domain-containing protein n=1 Tax=Eiseniibacteriota bacterium TaxID=2212470 RepID=A0A7V2AVA9_UNCEI|nr:PASTA domain-containing protein [Candidatus Eisenbacteria bacterium]